MDSKGEVLLTIMASLAQQEKPVSEPEHQTRIAVPFPERGKGPVNHSRFLGYTKDEEGNLIIEPAEAEVVKRIYREYLEGKPAPDWAWPGSRRDSYRGRGKRSGVQKH